MCGVSVDFDSVFRKAGLAVMLLLGLAWMGIGYFV